MRYFVLASVCLAAVIAYVQRTALSVPTKDVQMDLGTDEAGMGLIMGFWYWSYALMQLPAGWLTDRIGSKYSMALFVTLWSLLTGLAGLAGSYYQLLALWSLMGIAQTGLVPGVAKSIGTWFPPTGRALASGFFAASMALGSAIAPLIAGYLLGYFHWTTMLGLYLIPGVVWAAAYMAAIPDRKEAGMAPMALGETLVRMAGSRDLVLLCTQQFFRASAMALFFTWFPRFLQESKGLTQQEAGQWASLPGFGAMLGGIAGGIISDRILQFTGNRRLSRQGVALIGMITCSSLSLAAHQFDDTRTTVYLVSAAAFWAMFGGVSGYSVCIDLGGARIGTVISVMNMCGNIGAGLFPLVVGYWAKGVGHWNFVLPLFSAIFLVDAICWACINPVRSPFATPPQEPKP